MKPEVGVAPQNKRGQVQFGNSKSGGDLGEFGPGQMVKEFDEVVFSADIKVVQGPVKTQFGYHLLDVADRTE